jgi:single-strand DNA-binding protein
MADQNIVAITGRFTRNPEMKQVAGKSLTNFSIAVSKGGKGKEEVSYFDCIAWEKTADLINQYCTKGKQVNITGELKQDRWEKDGQKFSRVNIVVRQIQLLGSKDDQTPEPTPFQEPEPVKQPRQPEPKKENPVDPDDDIF